jgi:hypothetical protein
MAFPHPKSRKDNYRKEKNRTAAAYVELPKAHHKCNRVSEC